MQMPQEFIPEAIYFPPNKYDNIILSNNLAQCKKSVEDNVAKVSEEVI